MSLDSGVLLIQLPQIAIESISLDSVKNRWYFAYPPQGLLYISAIFGNLSIDTKIIDLNFELLSWITENNEMTREDLYKGIAQKIVESGIRTVCIWYMFDATFDELRQITAYIKNIDPGIHIIIGWVAATADSEKLLKSWIADTLIKYEAENSIEDLVNFARWDSQELPHNICFLDENKEQFSTSEKKQWSVSMDIGSEYAKIPIEKYHLVGTPSMFSKLSEDNLPYATILTRRGCRWKCSFCSVRSFNGKWVRVRDIDSVMEEMELLYSQYWVRHFELLDDDFLYDTTSVKELIHGIKWRFRDITWSANNWLIATNIDSELLELMENSWCLGFKVWLESWNPDILKRIHKPITVDRFYKFSRIAANFPWLFISTNFILWTPEETFSQMLDSFRVATNGLLDWNNFYIYQHFENTEFSTLFPSFNAKQSTDSIGRENNVSHETGTFTPMSALRNLDKNAPTNQHLISGYDIVNIPPDVCPTKDQVREIWFTFNTVSNFLLMPAIRTWNKKKLENGAKWVSVLSWAYPNDPMMKSLEYYLKWRTWDYSEEELGILKTNAYSIIADSAYWQMRDEQFHFSKFLTRELPDIDERFLNFIKTDTMQK
jgi:radical SAM superfamily enzyme YgiQ (UPF0313 family)